MVYVCGCSSRISVSGTRPARRSYATLFCRAHASSYGTRPSRRTSTSARGGPIRDLAGRVIRAADQRTRLDMPEAEPECLDFEHGKFVRGNVARDRQMVGSRTQVLPNGQDLDVVRPQVAKDLDHLVDLLAQAEHDPGLGIDGRAHPLGALQELERARIAALRPHLRIETWHRFDVVVEDVGTGAHHGGERGLVAHEIGDQHLDVALWDALADLPDGPGEDGGPTVLELVAVDRGDDGMMQAHPLDRLGDTNRLAKVEDPRPAGLDRAEAAGPGAGVAEDHEGRRARLPALADVGAARLLAHGVQVEAAHDLFQLGIVGATG